MASTQVEASFVGQFWRAAQAEGQGDEPAAWQATSRIQPEHLEHAGFRRTYEILQLRFSEGVPMTPDAVIDDLRDAKPAPDGDSLNEVIDAAFTSAQLEHFADRVLNDYRRRELRGLYSKGAAALESAGDRGGAHSIADRIQLQTMELFTGSMAPDAFKTKDELVDEGIARARDPASPGLVVPWPKLDRACGPWVPGEVVGVSAFSGSGKSTFVASMFFEYARRGIPVIAFPTEMRERWLDRAVAALTRVDQWRAEKSRWKGADDQLERFVAGYEQVRSYDWTVVNRAAITPTEISIATRILRRRWEGRPVVVIVDHMHRLDYGGEDPDDVAGGATQLLKNLAGDDRGGGMVMVLLYQPRKPSDNIYRPISPHEIRGHSRIWNELDVYLSPFRAWVETMEVKTDWGTRRCKYHHNGKPALAKPNAAGAKIDDEHFYVKVGKRRVGGEGETVVLDFHAPSGQVTEYARAS